MKKYTLIIFCTLLIGPAGFSQQSNLKILSYNVLHGFENDTAKITEYVDWVSKLDPDIIAYQELNDFTQEKLETLAKRYGHPYVAINLGVTHPIGLSSRYPIVMIQKVVNNMWHSYLYGNINGTHVFVTHLSPFEVTSRRNDVEMILAHTRLIPANERIIIAGDFNSLAAIDSVQYDSTMVNSMRRLEGRKEPKSGLAIVNYKTIYRNNMDNGNIDYTVTGKMLAGGFKDAFYLANNQFKSSAPTKVHAGTNSKPHRIDYIWVNGTAAKKVKTADIIHDKHTDSISDHYPVMIELAN